VRKLLSAAALAVCIGARAIPAQAAPTSELSGTWVLVEQTYGNGSSNLADAHEPIRLRIERAPEGPLVRIWQGAAEAGAIAWPALIAEGRVLRSTARSVRFDAATATLSGRCRLVPVEGEDLELDIREDYTLAADGKTLAGTVEVVFVTPRGTNGGYTLHRKFERER